MDSVEGVLSIFRYLIAIDIFFLFVLLILIYKCHDKLDDMEKLSRRLKLFEERYIKLVNEVKFERNKVQCKLADVKRLLERNSIDLNKLR